MLKSLTFGAAAAGVLFTFMLFPTLAAATTVSFTPSPANIGVPFQNTNVDLFSTGLNGMTLSGQSLSLDLLLTNGGFGSVQIALAHGVPIVAIGKTEEKPELANRITWSRVGIGMKILKPTEVQIRDAVSRVLSNPSYAMRAGMIAHEMRGLDAPTCSADLLERLVDEKRLARTA